MTAPEELPEPLPEPDPPRELTWEQRFADALRHYVPPLGRLHRRTVMLPAIVELFPRVEAALRAGVPARVVLEAASRDGMPQVRETAEHALRALDRGHPVDEVLEIWSLILEERWAHLGPGRSAPQLPASSPASLRIHAEWVNRIAQAGRLFDELSTLTAQARLSAVVLGGMPLGLAFIISLISPGFMRTIGHLLAPVAIAFLAAFALVAASFGWAKRRATRAAHPLTAFLAVFAAHLDAGAAPDEAFARAAPALPSRASTLPAVVEDLRARGIDPDPLAPVAIALALPAFAAPVRARAVEMLYDRARELEQSRTALSVSGFNERALWLAAAGGASLAATVAALLWNVLRPLL